MAPGVSVRLIIQTVAILRQVENVFFAENDIADIKNHDLIKMEKTSE